MPNTRAECSAASVELLVVRTAPPAGPHWNSTGPGLDNAATHRKTFTLAVPSQVSVTVPSLVVDPTVDASVVLVVVVDVLVIDFLDADAELVSPLQYGHRNSKPPFSGSKVMVR